MRDSEKIEPSDTLYRWLHPSQYKWDEGRPSSAAFNDSYMSVDVSKLTSLQQSYERAKKYNKNAVVSFKAEVVIQKGQEVVHCPTHIVENTENIVCRVRNDCTAYSENISSDCLVCINNAHGCVIGKKNKAFARDLAKTCKVEICPPFPDDSSVESININQ